MSRKKSVVALIVTVSCLFSIISARMTVKPVATPDHCVIHDLPEGMPVLLNTSDGTVGALTFDCYQKACAEQLSSNSGGIVLTSFFTFECHYSDFKVTSDSSSRYIKIEIPKDHIALYDHHLATHYICTDCLRDIEIKCPTSNILFLTKSNKGFEIQCLKDFGQRFSISNYSFIVSNEQHSNLIIKMQRREE